MSRVPLSDETPDLDDDIIEEEEGTVGAEEQYADLSFDDTPETVYEPDSSWLDDEDPWLNDEDDFAAGYPVEDR